MDFTSCSPFEEGRGTSSERKHLALANLRHPSGHVSLSPASIHMDKIARSLQTTPVLFSLLGRNHPWSAQGPELCLKREDDTSNNGDPWVGLWDKSRMHCATRPWVLVFSVAFL